MDSIKNPFTYLLQKYIWDILKMGCIIDKNSEIKNKSQTKSLQQINRLTELQYCRKILEIGLDTLFDISHKFPEFSMKTTYKRKNKVDCSCKTLEELTSQLQINVMLFQIAKQNLHPAQPFEYDQQMTQKTVRELIGSYFKYFSQVDKEIALACQNLLNILDGNYCVSIQRWKSLQDLQNPEKKKNKIITKVGIEATLMKEDIEADIALRMKGEKFTLINSQAK